MLRKPFEGGAGTVPLQNGEESEARNRAGFGSLGQSLRVFETPSLAPLFDFNPGMC